MRVDIETVRRMTEERQAINKIAIDKLELYENGQLILIDKEIRERFELTGLSTIDFITSGYWKK